MANKYLVETAIDVGIDNLKKLRNTDPKALYEEVKKEIATESSPEIKKLYQNYIDLYEKSLAVTNTKTGALGEEIKWKNLGDLKKAVEAKGVGLSPSDREGLNQFALAEYARRSSPGEAAGDTDTIALLHAWFRIYESLKSAPTATVAPASSTNSTPSTPSSLPEKLKYDLKVYEGYAIQELTKSVRTIRDLKAALVMKGELKLEINNVFDQATLDAIFAYQKSAKLKEVDGLVGAETIGSLFGIALGNPAIGPQDIPYPVTPSKRSPIGSQGVPYPVTPGVQSQTIVEPPATIEPVRNISKEFTTAYNDLMAVAKGADKWFWEQDDKTVTANKQKMGNAYANFQKALSALNISTLSPADRADAEKKIRDVALYFSNSLTGVSNSHFRNYQLSAGLLISLLDKDSGGKEISGWPKAPTEADILKKLKGTPSGDLMLAQMESGAKFWDIVANPKFNGAWESIQKEAYGKYTAELEAFVKKLDTNQSAGKLILTIPQQESLKALKALIGAGTGWDYFSAQSKDNIVGMGKAVPAILVGGAIAATGIGAGPGAFLVATGFGALATTGGMMIAQNRLYTDPTEIAKEAGLNTITLGAGGVIFRLGGKYLSASKGLHYTNMGLLQPLGNVAIGASTDVIRGQLEKTDVRFTDAFWHNAPWALLPLVLAGKGWKWTPKQLEGAKKTEQALHDIERKAALGGDTTAAQKKLAQDVAEQSADIKNTVQSSDHPTPASNNTSAVGGKPLEPLPPITEPHAPAGASKTKTAEKTVDPHAKAPAKQPKKSTHIDEHTAHTTSDDTVKSVNQTLAGWTDNSIVKFAWDAASKEIPPGGFIRTALTFPGNLLRLPAINTRKVMGLWFKKGDKGFEFSGGDAFEKIGNTLKVAATSSSTPFTGKTQSMLTLMTMGTVAYMTYQEIQSANPNVPARLSWGMALDYLKNMNITLPMAFWDWFFNEKINVPGVIGSEVPAPTTQQK